MPPRRSVKEDVDHIEVAKTSDAGILYDKKVLTATLKMLKMRGFDVSDMIDDVEKIKNADDFQLAVLGPDLQNPLRDILSTFFKRPVYPSLRIMMSMLFENTSDAYTAVFFAERRAKQVSKRLIEYLFDAITFLKTAKFHVNEIIIITPVPMSSEAQKKYDASTHCFTQVFRDYEVLSPPTECVFSPLATIMTQQETQDFFARETLLTHHKMQRIDHNDVLMKYLGAKPGRVVKLIRAAVVPMDIRRTELAFAWII